MRVLGSLFPAMAWIFEPTLPSEEGVGWGDLPELLEFGDCPPSPRDSDAESTLSQLQSPQPPHSDTPSHTPITPIPPTTPAHTRITNALLHTTHHIPLKCQRAPQGRLSPPISRPRHWPPSPIH